ncbi:MAG: C39 family peptidase, partial [Sciscionella sp.]
MSYRQWRADGFADGESCGCRVADDGLLLDVPTETTAYADSVHGGTDRSYEYGSWRSPAIAGMSAAAEIVPSWNARTPPGTWVEVALLIGSGADANRYVLGRWASDSSTIHRTTVPAQHDGLAQVDVDTLVAVGGHDTGFAEYRVEVRLLRAAGSTASPVLTLVGVMCSTARPAARAGIDTGPGSAVGSALDVPAYSQAMHKGQYRQWASGGASWCSPTATSMVLGYWKSGPRAADYAWVDSEIADPQVVYAAAATYD